MKNVTYNIDGLVLNSILDIGNYRISDRIGDRVWGKVMHRILDVFWYRIRVRGNIRNA